MLYAAYGSNLNLEQMEWRCPDSKVLACGIIKDMRLVFNTHADIIPSKGSCVPVAVFEVPKQDWQWLDKYEGYPKYYVKESFNVILNDGKKEECIAYVMAKDRKGFAPPYEDYFDTIMQGYADNNIKETAMIYSAIAESWEKWKEDNYAKSKK